MLIAKKKRLIEAHTAPLAGVGNVYDLGILREFHQVNCEIEGIFRKEGEVIRYEE